jgi:5-methylcytosine-specific restriction endonuclease McrA
MRKEFTAKIKVLAFERSGGRCEICQAKLFTGNIEYDHVVPCALDGEAILTNCCCVCKNCHRSKSSKEDVPRIAKAHRNYRTSHGIKKARTITAWRKFNGEIVKASRAR